MPHPRWTFLPSVPVVSHAMDLRCITWLTTAGACNQHDAFTLSSVPLFLRASDSTGDASRRMQLCGRRILQLSNETSTTNAPRMCYVGRISFPVRAFRHNVTTIHTVVHLPLAKIYDDVVDMPMKVRHARGVDHPQCRIFHAFTKTWYIRYFG